MERTEAAEWIRSAEQLKAHTRRARRGFWFPLTIFGVLTMAAAPLYREAGSGSAIGTFLLRPSPFDIAPSLFAGSSRLISLFWLLALPTGFALTAWYYRRRALRTGAQASLRPYVLAGAELFFLLFALSPSALTALHFPGYGQTSHAAVLAWLIGAVAVFAATTGAYITRKVRTGSAGWTCPFVISALAIVVFAIASSTATITQLGWFNLRIWEANFQRGTTPLIAIALGLFVLARVERSVGLAAFAAAFLGVAVTSNLYNMENFFSRLGMHVPAPAINVIVPGVLLLVAGLGFGLRQRGAQR